VSRQRLAQRAWIDAAQCTALVAEIECGHDPVPQGLDLATDVPTERARTTAS